MKNAGIETTRFTDSFHKIKPAPGKNNLKPIR